MCSSDLLFVVGLYMEGGLQTELSYRERIAEMQKKIDIAQQQSKETNARIEQKVAEKLKNIKDNVNANHQKIEASRNAINAECKLSDTAWLLYNGATQNAVSRSTSESTRTS